MIVYRFESPIDGRGPYRSAYCVLGFFGAHTRRSGHPAPKNDTFTEYQERKFRRSGFISMEQVHNWFSSENIISLYEAGFVLVTLDVPDRHVVSSQKQALYNPRFAVVLETEEDYAYDSLQI